MRLSLSVPVLLLATAFAAPNVPHPVQNQQRLRIPDFSLDSWLSIQKHIWTTLKVLKDCMGWKSEMAIQEEEPEGQRSVYELLSADENFSKIVTLIDLDSELVQYMSDLDESFTFFAPTDAGFPPPPDPEISFKDKGPASLITLYHYFMKYPTDESDPDTEGGRQALLQILHQIFQYHILPVSHSSAALKQNRTVATALTLPNRTLLSKPLRIRLATTLRPLPTLELNFHGHVKRADITATNGVVHELDHPLDLPLSALQTLYALPLVYSISSGALGKTGLGDAVEWAVHADADNNDTAVSKTKMNRWVGNPAVTVFAPTNAAWAELPLELTTFLFSPWGENALRELLAFHIVNETVLHSDVFHHSPNTSSNFTEGPQADRYQLPTLLPNHTLTVHIFKSNRLPIPLKDTIEVQGTIVRVADTVARNGAVHGVDTVLNPLGGMLRDGSGVRDWKGRENWLMDWAAHY